MRQLSGMDATFLNMETRSTFGHVSSLNIFDVSGLDRRQLLRRHPASRRGAPRAAAAVSSPPRRGSPRPRPAVLDRGPRLRSRLSCPPPRRPCAGHSPAAERRDQPDPRPPARSHPTAVGAVRHRRRRRRANGRDVHQGPPRHDRWSVGGDDARQPSRRRPRGQPDPRGGSVAVPRPFPPTAS